MDVSAGAMEVELERKGGKYFQRMKSQYWVAS
jgi:hypothetical protein